MKYNILVKNKEKERACTEDKHLMSSLSVCTDLAPRGCHNGACGVCKILVHSGDYEKQKMNRKHISEDEESSNIVLACKTFPKSDMEIEFIGKAKTKLYALGN
jgi:ferredoxin